MEFTDVASGINPFIPKTTNISTRILKYTLGFFMLLIRLPILVVLFTLLFIYHTFFKGLMVVKERVILGNFFLPKVQIYPKWPPDGSFYAIIQVLSIYSIYHTCIFSHLRSDEYSLSPTFVKIFVKIKTDGQREVLLAPLNYFSMIKFFFSKDFHLPVVSNEVEMATMAPYRKLNTTRLGELNFEQKEGPIVVFFEGGYTNGKGVLEIDEMLASDIFDYSKKYLRMPVLISLRYDDTGNSTVRHPVLACLSILMNVFNSLDVRITPFRELNFQKKFMATKIHEIFETEQGLPKLSLNFESYKRFLEGKKSENSNEFEKLKNE